MNVMLGILVVLAFGVALVMVVACDSSYIEPLTTRPVPPRVPRQVYDDEGLITLARTNHVTRRLRDMHINVTSIEQSGGETTLHVEPVPGRPITPLLDATPHSHHFIAAAPGKPVRLVARLEGILIKMNLPETTS